MKRIVIALLLVMLAASAQATTIQDIQTGAVTLGDAVTLTGVVVTAVRYNGMFVAEAPYGPLQQIWIFVNADPGVAAGDLVDVEGTYAEYYDFSEVNATAFAVSGTAAAPAPIVVPAALLAADGEPYESCLINVPDQLVVTVAPNAYGEWAAQATDGTEFVFDDYWFDDTTVLLGDCYSSITGILTYSFGAYKIEPLADGIVGCTVDNETASFGTIKSLFR